LLNNTLEGSLSQSGLSFILTRNSAQKDTDRLCRGSMRQYVAAVRVSYVIPEHRIHGMKILREKRPNYEADRRWKDNTQHVFTLTIGRRFSSRELDRTYRSWNSDGGQNSIQIPFSFLE